MPVWVDHLARGMLLCGMMVFSAIVLARAGRTPYWALLTVVPYGFILGLWLFAFVVWSKTHSR